MGRGRRRDVAARGGWRATPAGVRRRAQVTPRSRRHGRLPGRRLPMLTSRPRAALLALLLFVIVAGVVGGPLAGRLSSDGGFVAPGADSEVAVERISAATGRDAGAGIVLLTPPAARDGAATRVRQVPGVADVATPGPRVVAATLRAGADAHAAAE